MRHQHESQANRLLRAAITLTLGALGACRVGPDYREPEPGMPAAWSGVDTAPQVASTTDSPAVTSRPIAVQADLSQWWTGFQDATLNSLIARAAVDNLDLHAAEARLRQARAARTIAGASRLPTIDASASATRSDASSIGRSSVGNQFRAGFDASWELDVFGGVRRAVEAADADLDGSIADRNDVLVSLVAEVATTYFDLRGAQHDLAITLQNLDAQRQTVELTSQRQLGGFVGALDVTNARAQVASTTARIPTLETSVRSSIHALSVLLGLEPAALAAELTPVAELPPTPPEVPIGLPSDLVRRRPDIRRAESDLHAANARIGVATADQFPKFTLGASAGLLGTHFGDLGRIDNHFWSIGPSVSLPLFDGGRLQAGVDLQEAAKDAAFAAWRKSVIVALQEVEDALVAYTNEQKRHAALVEALRVNDEALDLARQLYSAGRTDFLNVLGAQRSRFDSDDALAQSNTSLLTDLVALYKALGGGWPSAATSAAESSGVPAAGRSTSKVSGPDRS